MDIENNIKKKSVEITDWKLFPCIINSKVNLIVDSLEKRTVKIKIIIERNIKSYLKLWWKSTKNDQFFKKITKKKKNVWTKVESLVL